MKKYFISLLSLLVLIINPLVIQAVEDFGIKGGVNFSGWQVSGALLENQQKLGFNIGVHADLKLNDSFSIQPEILFISKGYYTNGTIMDPETRMIYTIEETGMLDYLEIPVLLNFHLSENVKIMAGPYFAYNLGAKVEYKVAGYTETAPLDNFICNTDYGALLGLAYNKNNISFEIRYEQGLANILRNVSPGCKASNYSLSAFYSVKI
ncbi:porin family protein [Candidatus Margulisiibacteriota bacterium]